MSGSPWTARRLSRSAIVVGVATVLALTAAAVAASAAELYGVVTSGGQGQPGVAVELSGQGRVETATTTSRGTYRFRDIPPGSYRLKTAGEERAVTVGPGVNRFNVAR